MALPLSSGASLSIYAAGRWVLDERAPRATSSRAAAHTAPSRPSAPPAAGDVTLATGDGARVPRGKRAPRPPRAPSRQIAPAERAEPAEPSAEGVRGARRPRAGSAASPEGRRSAKSRKSEGSEQSPQSPQSPQSLQSQRGGQGGQSGQGPRVVEASELGANDDRLVSCEASSRGLDEILASHLAELETRAGARDALSAEAAALRERAGELSRRHEIHARRELLERAERLEADARDASETLERQRGRSELYRRALGRARFLYAERASDRGGGPMERVLAAYARDEAHDPRATSTSAEDLETCQACGNCLQLVAHVSLLACSHCGLSRVVLDGQASSSCVRDDFIETSITTKRVAHWVEFLRSAQARSSCSAPESVVALVAERLQGVATPLLVREALKSLGYSRYYSSAPALAARISGARPPSMSPLEEEKLRLMFVRACTSFQHCVARGVTQRTNFLPYPFIARKLCELLGLQHMIPWLIQLRAAVKVDRSDVIWKCICDDVPWPFVPTDPC